LIRYGDTHRLVSPERWPVLWKKRVLLLDNIENSDLGLHPRKKNVNSYIAECS